MESEACTSSLSSLFSYLATTPIIVVVHRHCCCSCSQSSTSRGGCDEEVRQVRRVVCLCNQDVPVVATRSSCYSHLYRSTSLKMSYMPEYETRRDEVGWGMLYKSSHPCCFFVSWLLVFSNVSAIMAYHAVFMWRRRCY